MKSSLLLYVLLINTILFSTIPKSQECFCNQMYKKAECIKKTECSWDEFQKLCFLIETEETSNIKTITYLKSNANNNNSIIIQQGISLYCNKIQKAQLCQSTFSCAWIEQKCTHFTTRSKFNYKQESECSSISNRCTSDGNNCIEKNACSTYITETSCKTNLEGKFCFWKNLDQKNAQCEDVKDCSQLSTSLTTDSQCRFQLPQCTVKVDVGCIESGENCQDQLNKIVCITNRSGDQQCFWMDNKCLDKVCENAPQLLISDSDCNNFLSTCTTKTDGGCILRKQCSDALIEAACITDIKFLLMGWNIMQEQKMPRFSIIL